MVQATAAASMAYGNDCSGVADTMLHRMRSCTARAGVGAAAGKDVDRSFYGIDGAHGTADPAFAIHGSGICQWALAYWENWAPQAVLRVAFDAAREKLAKPGRGSRWSRVTGPVTALILTMERIGWHWQSATSVTDDTGRLVDLLQDSPAAVKKLVKHSVRRWRLGRIVTSLPGLDPASCNIRDPARS